MANKVKSKQTIFFAPYAGLPQDKGRTPEWDSEEEELFSDVANDEYLKSQNLDYTRDGIYYLDSEGKYMPGTIYHNNNGTWNHYQLWPDTIRGFDLSRLSPRDYQLLQKDLGIDLNRFYSDGKFPEKYIPLDPEFIKSQFPTSYQVGNTTIEYDFGDISTIYNQDQLDKRLAEGERGYHIIDPDNGYDFNIRKGTLREGGSKTFNIYGTFPDEWGQYNRKIIYPWNGDTEKAKEIRQSLNNIFKNYNIQFKKGGRLIPKHKHGNFLKLTPRSTGFEGMAYKYSAPRPSNQGRADRPEIENIFNNGNYIMSRERYMDPDLFEQEGILQPVEDYQYDYENEQPESNFNDEFYSRLFNSLKRHALNNQTQIQKHKFGKKIK